MTAFQSIMNIVRRHSIHVCYVDAGSCNGCGIEVLACLAPRYDIEQYGIVIHNNPREADILLVAGAFTPGWDDKLRILWDNIPAPKAAIAIGNCPQSGSLFNRRGSYIDPPVSKHIPVYATVSGCPPRPTEIIAAILAQVPKIFPNFKVEH